MPAKIYCTVCEKLDSISNQYRSLGRLGASSRQAMKRLHVRLPSGTYSGVGYICEQGHVVQDGVSGNGTGHHVVTPTIPAHVVCMVTGELVTPDEEPADAR